LARTQSKAFQATVKTCAENNTYEALLALTRKHGDALPNALVIFIGAQLRALQSRGRCLPADVHYILGLTRPNITGKGSGKPSSSDESMSDEELKARLLAATDDLLLLYKKTCIRYEPLVAIATFAFGLQAFLEVAAIHGDHDGVRAVRQSIHDDAFLYSTRPVD
jgi:hypothetical protein